MRKPLLTFVLGFALAASLPAIASHIAEPTAPIAGMRLFLENYAQNIPVDCSGAEPYPFTKVRVAMYVQASAAPSAHFVAGYRAFWLFEDPRGVERWVAQDDPSWPHQNVPPHSSLTKFDASRLSDIGGLLEHPGTWRVTATITGQESGRTFTETCTFRVA